MRYAATLVSFVMLAAPAFAAGPSSLIGTGRTDTTLSVEWQSGGYTHFALDYLGPEVFGTAQPTCESFPMHDTVRVVEGDAAVISGLQASTWYQIHVHAYDPSTGRLVEGVSSTNVMIVKTGADGTFEPLEPGASDYILCGSGGGGGGEGGGDDEGCAQLTFTLLPGSQPVPDVNVTLVDPSSGVAITSFPVLVGEPVSAPAGSFHFLFTAPAGYAVSPGRRGLNLKCGDDRAIRLTFRRARR